MLPGTHLAMALPVVLAAHQPLAAGVGFLVGSVLPDKLDFFLSGGNFESWSRIHRTWTHTWWLLAGFFALSFLIPDTSDLFETVGLAMKGVFLGMLYHVFCDMFTPMGVPVLNPAGTRRGFALVPARGLRSTLLFWAMAALSAYLLWSQYVVDSDIIGEAERYLRRLAKVFPQLQDLFFKPSPGHV